MPKIVNHLEIPKHFFRFKRNVYLDNNATTSVCPTVQRKMNRVLKYNYGNPSSLYSVARKSAQIMAYARHLVADAINAEPEEIFFTGCATESNNAVLKSVYNTLYPARKKIITTPVEHPSILNTLQFLETKGVLVNFCPIDKYGRVIISELEKLVDDNTMLICCMLANNEIGTIQDVTTVASIADKYGILVLSDCVQAFGKIPINVKELGVHYASFSAHKLYGPKGVGVLYIKNNAHLLPILHGGHQENGMRAGTESTHNIAGFGAACQKVESHLRKSEKIQKLKEFFIKAIKEIRPDCIINSPNDYCLPNTISISFPGIKNTELIAMLDHYGISVSAGSACSSQEDKPSHVLQAIGLTSQTARETIRLSLSSFTSKKDIRYVIRIFNAIFNGKIPQVNLILPAQLTESVLFDRNTFILDVRPDLLRKKDKGLPNSHEIPFVFNKKYLHKIPKDKRIIVVCQGGYFSYITAHYLRSVGYTDIYSLSNGIIGWKAQHIDLYKKYAGYNVTVL